jgi:sulfite reductase (NADPH) flavoprotein alpha-component
MDHSNSTLAVSSPPSAYSRQHPFLAELIRHDRLTGPGSLKDTRHFVLNIEGSGLTYLPGDSLGTFGRNSPDIVDEVIRLLGFDPFAPVLDPKGQPTTLRQTLMEHYTVNRANRKIMAGLAARTAQGEARNRLMELVDNDDLLSEYVGSRDYVDVLREFPEARFDTPGSFLSQLSPAAPRLYSIASSPNVHPGEVQLCVAIVRYDSHGRARKGLASGFLADQAGMFVKNIPVYVQESRAFRLPRDNSADIIMCGPGAGIAPFRAFIEQRAFEGAKGRNWLFFGEQHRATDFLYGPELLEYLKQRKLHRLDLAFSRDQPHKTYVQHRMRESAGELWAWLKGGAFFYVCGDARHMAKEVHQTLIEIAQNEGKLSLEAASEYVNVTLMKTEKRYLRDVY